MKVRKRDFSQIKDDQILSNTEEGQNKIKTLKKFFRFENQVVIGELNFSENNVEVGKINFKRERGRITEEDRCNPSGRR